VFIAGAAIQWLRDGLGVIATAAETEAMAMSVPDTGGVTFVPAFVGLGTPHWEPEARGTITGITRGTTRAQLVRAAVASIAYGTADLLRAVMASSALEVPVLRVDGGAAANDFLMQFQADLLGVPVERPAMLETTALGAAALAGIGTGVWKSVEELRGTVEVRRFEPKIRGNERAARIAAWERAVHAALAWARYPA
jgi:glycerol kinase